MKHLNFLSNLLSLSLGSPCTDVSLDRRLTVGSPSFDCRSAMLKLVSVLVLVLTIGVGDAWGAVGDAITSHTNIADATVYYLAGQATVSSKTNTYYSLLASDEEGASITGNATTTKASGTKYTFLKENSKYYLVTPNGYYVEPHGSSNGKLILTAAAKAVTVSTVSSKIRITGTTNTGKSIQKNKTTAANFGSYGNTQNDLTLYIAGYRVIYDKNGATGGTVPNDATVYGDNATATIKANTGTLVKTGYTFAGWNTAANGSGTDVSATGSATRTITAGLRLYAKWTSAPSCDAPTAPTNGSVSGTTQRISTTSASADYDFYCSTTNSTSGATAQTIQSVTGGQSRDYTGLSYGTTYYYWMRKNCGGGSTSSWVAGSPTTFTTTVPAPTGVSAGSLSMTGATISITDANNVNSYDVYCSESSTAPEAGTTPSASGTSKSIAVTGLTAGRTYYYWARAKGPNAKSTWYGGSTFTTLTLSSISVSTAPTKTKYLVGDNFDPTGLVIKRTFSDDSYDTYTYADHTAEFSFSPATNAALTALNTSVTITYGGQTASQAINVYTVTVDKVNMSGTAITADGVTASCSGRTLSQSVGSTNYKFEEYAVTAGGVTISTNTITGTPTGNVTINAKFHDPITVTWKVGSGAASGGTGEVKYGTAIAALPSTPADNALASCGTNKFMGWTALGELKGTGNDAPADLFTTVGGATALTENTTYRAVFANGSGSGSEGYNKVTSTGNITNDGRYLIVYESGNVAFNGNLTTLDASSNVVTATVSTSAIAVNDDNRTTLANAEFSIDMTNKYIKSHSNKYINYNSYGGGLTASADATAVHSISIDGSGNLVIEGTGQNSSSPYDYVVLRFNSNTGSGNWRFRFYKGTQQAIQLYKYDPGTTYSDYQTGCCSAPGTALSITSANSVATGGTVSLTSTGGNGGTVTWSVVNGTGTASVAGTTLTAGSVGTVTVKAHQDATGSYCAQDAEQAFTVVSSTVNVTGVEVSPTSKAIVPGETFDITPTISPSNATDKSVSWTSSASDKASVSSGTVTGVAAGTANITCTTTDGSYTATTAVTVYGVTMQALDEDGNAIAVGGPGTPSRSGASISPAADAGNYVFKEWAISGASLGSSASTKANTITNPTGAVTVTAKYYKPRTVKWSVNGNDSYEEGSPTLTVAYNSAISAVPDAPDDDALNNCANKFMGWSTKNAGTTPKTTSYYDDLFTNASGYTTNITAATTTFYAVFAEAETGVWTLDYSEETNLSSSTDWSYGNGLSYTASDGGTWVVKANKNSGMQINSGKNSSIKIPDCSGNITSIVITGSTAKTVRFSQSDYDGSSFGVIEVTGSDNYTQTLDFAGKSLTAGYIVPYTNANALTNIVVNYGSASNYVTQCDANIVRVTYDFNGGTGTACTEGVTTKSDSYSVCSTEPEKNYYDFAGWSDGTNTYDAGDTYNLQATTEFTATWTPTVYTITYNLNGGTQQVTPAAPTSYTYESSAVTLPTPTYGHNRFDGWYGNADLSTGGVQTSIAAGSNGDKAYYAKWTERHTIVFDADGTETTIWRASDEALNASLAGQGSVPSNPSAPSTCSSKVFMGWTETEIYDFTNSAPADLMTTYTGTVSSDKHYYAVWATRSGSVGSYTYSAYATTCCDNHVTLSSPSITGSGTVVFTPVSPAEASPDGTYATCRNNIALTATVTPASGYTCTALSFTRSDSKDVDIDPTISGNLPSAPSAQDFVLSFDKNTNVTVTTAATFTAKGVTGWTWKQATVEEQIDIPATVDLYIGQEAWFDLISFTPSDVISDYKGYTPTYNSDDLAQGGKGATRYKIRAKVAKTSMSLTLTSDNNGSVQEVITIRGTALPTATFVDNIHNKTDFTTGDAALPASGILSATIDGTDKRIVHLTQKTPNHADVAEPGSGNACEKSHLHLVGWIDKDWADEHPNATHSEILGAGTGVYYAANTDIDLSAKNGKTFLAVWSKIE